MKITLFNDEGQIIFKGTPGEVAEGLRSGTIFRSDLAGLSRETEFTPSPTPHNKPYDRSRKCYVSAAGAYVRGDMANFRLWVGRGEKAEDWQRGNWVCSLGVADSVVGLAREAGCSEKEISSFLERRLDFRFTEPETAKVARAEFGSSGTPAYVLFDNGSCYTHETKVSSGNSDKFFGCSVSWDGDGLYIGGACRYKIQPRKYDWLEPFLKAAYANNVNPLPLLRQITSWQWEMGRSATPGESYVHYRGPVGDAPGIGTDGNGLTGSGFSIKTAEARRLQAINEKFSTLPIEGTAEEVADWLGGFRWCDCYKPRTVARFLLEHWNGRMIRVETANFSARARQGTITAEGWKFVDSTSGERVACFSSDGFFNNLGLKTPGKLTATPMVNVLFGQGPVGCE